MNLAAVVRDHAIRNGGKTAIRFRDESITYEALWSRIETIAAALVERGVSAGDRVGLSMSEHPDHLAAHFAIARLGAVIVPMDHRWTENEKSAAAQAFGADVVLRDGDRLEGGSDLPPIDEQDCDLLVSLSSGTTGRPKGALVTHRNLYERFVSQWKVIGYGADDCFAVLTPFYFGAGRSFGMSLLAAGGTVLIAPPPMKPPEIVDALSDESVTATFLPPTLLRRLLPLHKNGAPPLLANIRHLVVSGEPLYADEARECLEIICPNLFSYYASSEGGGISVLGPDEFAEHAATVGKPTYKTEVQIVDSEDNELPSGEVGRLRYRGPGVATRYLDSDGVEHDAGSDGWFYPGDLAEKLESGHIALRGRDKDVIIRGGVNIYPAEIESALLRHESVDEVAVLGRDDTARGQVVVAFVATVDDVDAGVLEAYCRENLAPYKVPQEFRILDALPKRSSGKVDKQALTDA